MHWLTIAMIGIAANLDNLGIGMTFGARKVHIPLISSLVIAILSMIATCLSMLLGHYLSSLLPAYWGNLIGGLMIITLGVWGLISSLRKRSDSDIIAQIADDKDKNKDQVISWVESFSLGFALSLNCIASSLGAGASGVSPWFTALSVGFFSLVSIDIGGRMGKRIAHSWLGKYSELLGCLLLIAIGCYEVIV
ncbi:putative sporulation protein YtaF [Paenibacillus cellulosilyticus]|uniref:Putative sporulation protein YtaF n=1 Tax=Paenibacillus cellulosilyticus TaxID=375489 RepID=A0A2V2YZ13_9BACL|nr:manganese efflux pump [Paenibacillus cellulosilyticus]PWW05104.1 putative sporulation protein YtaF [Paenibacillus cellulosilyticus]QKS48655.1 manganese efflux pump [Paenibacillus cellulosilyticus]